MMEKDVKNLLRKNQLSWKDFQEFMKDKTIAGLTKDERKVPRATYWVDDVKKFVRSKTDNPIW